MNNAIEYAYAIIDEIKLLKNVNVQIIDADKAYSNNQTIVEAFVEFFDNAHDDIANGIENYNFCLMIGIDKFIKESSVDEDDLNQQFQDLNDSGKYCFVLIDNVKRLSEHEYDAWYSNNVSSQFGIWIGKGITDQSLINSDYNMENDCNRSFGYVINDGEGTFIKLLGMKEEKGD